MSREIIRFTSEVIFSKALDRAVTLSVISPAVNGAEKALPVLLINDGQDFDALKLHGTVEKLWRSHEMQPYLIVGIHADHDRIHEYGIASESDYAGRGSRALKTSRFVVDELLPHLQLRYNCANKDVVYAGFSLGGLMTLDIVWNHPHIFAAAGVFSGSLWWRRRSLQEGYQDLDRIMHQQIRDAVSSPALKFWFQCGSRDETDDRDQDGVIDSIQDTLDCIAELEKKGYRWNDEVRYVEVEGGEHNPGTWGQIMPEFLKWAFPPK